MTVASVLGELLLMAGAVLGLFVVWQLWWTDVVALEDRTEILAGLTEDWGPAPDAVVPYREGPPPPIAAPADAEVFATLHVPAFDRPVIPLAEGVGTRDVLDVLGAGRYPGTALPGEVGNLAIAGHRTTYGRPFVDIARLEEGDAVVVGTADAFLVYEVTGHRIVSPSASEVIAPVPGEPGVEPTERLLTLTACHPLYSARERYIVHARFVGWTAREDGPPAVLDGEGGA